MAGRVADKRMRDSERKRAQRREEEKKREADDKEIDRRAQEKETRLLKDSERKSVQQLEEEKLHREREAKEEETQHFENKRYKDTYKDTRPKRVKVEVMDAAKSADKRKISLVVLKGERMIDLTSISPPPIAAPLQKPLAHKYQKPTLISINDTILIRGTVVTYNIIDNKELIPLKRIRVDDTISFEEFEKYFEIQLQIYGSSKYSMCYLLVRFRPHAHPLNQGTWKEMIKGRHMVDIGLVKRGDWGGIGYKEDYETMKVEPTVTQVPVTPFMERAKRNTYSNLNVEQYQITMPPPPPPTKPVLRGISSLELGTSSQFIISRDVMETVVPSLAIQRRLAGLDGGKHRYRGSRKLISSEFGASEVEDSEKERTKLATEENRIKKEVNPKKDELDTKTKKVEVDAKTTKIELSVNPKNETDVGGKRIKFILIILPKRWG
ncbi:hypothetical protein P167DRAFT_579582 [Morchella conica CCBAS932]|uniref:Uncharacterized protein n=1 Tax=Morchella conica CCBAS932 TaxID=1392247 RepID=A0A3N4K9D2_9PEZI|nr:hypothetical protein P167DRAFT_579582 [Morchella conica CCBAS932]